MTMSGVIPSCETCKDTFQVGEAVLTSVSCGHSFHANASCVEELDISQRFDRVQVYSGGCRVVGCKYDGNLVLNSSKASPTTLLFRNLPVESIVRKASHVPASTSKTVADVPALHNNAASIISNVPSRHQDKRLKIGDRTIISEDREFDIDGSTEDIYDTTQPDSALNLPILPHSEESESEDDEEAMANVIAASQALQRMPVNGSAIYDETLAFDEDSTNMNEEDEDEEQPSSEQDDEGLPPDPYGMPPLSQWRRSARRQA